MLKLRLFILLALAASSAFAQQAVSPLVSSFEQYKQLKKESIYGVEWIQLGPTINSGRAESVQMDPTKPGTMYVAFGSGNLWKTVNNGLSWKPIFEDQPALGIGDIALAPSNTDIIYLGTGETLKKSRNFTMPGTGVYKSTDAGETWQHLGLEDSWHIGEIVVHPTNPDIVYVAVLGHFWSANPNRGVYRSVDGGTTWEHVLFIDDKTGAVDLVISPSDPKILYASMWENYPSISGKNSAVYASFDGGVTWDKRSKGLPQGRKTGRIGLAVSHQNPNKIYANVDNLRNKRNESSEIYRSLDGGMNWERTHKEELQLSPGIGWYFSDIYVNPQDDEEIYGLGVRIGHSSNGGKDVDLLGGNVFHIFPSDADPVHLDHCDMYINPTNPKHIALGNDGGLYVTYDKGANWTHFNNIPVGEFYDITADKQKPYMIYGGTQDNSTVYGPSKEWNPLYADDWKYLWVDAWSGGDGCITQVPDDDPNTVYFSSQNGGITRKDLAKGRSVRIKPKLKKGNKKLRFNFIAPYFISPHHTNTLYHAGNYVFKTTNRGDDWETISPDLAASSDSTKKAEAIGAIAESPITKGLLYAGTDKGAFWVSHNDGEEWEEKSLNLPNNYIRSIVASRYKESRVYITLTGINYDDLHNYIFVSEDYGANWKQISANLPDEIANVISEDPIYENVLYAGLYRGMYISTNRGESWSLLGRNLAAICISDIFIQEDEMDLLVGTHGRGIYKFNLNPLHQLFENKEAIHENTLFTIPTVSRPGINDTHSNPDFNTVEKVPVSFWLTNTQTVTFVLLDEDGKKIWTRKFDARKGFNQFHWDLIFKEEDSSYAYFIHYQRFLKSGNYQFTIETEENTLKETLTVTEQLK